MKRNEDNIKWTNIWMIEISEKEEKKKKKVWENICRDCSQKFPNKGMEIATQVQKAKRVPYRIREKHAKKHMNQTNKN